MNADRQLARVIAGLDAIADQCGISNLRAGRVSAWSIGQHIEHALKTDGMVLGILTASPVAKSTVRPAGFIARWILLTGHIARGRGQAPQASLPTLTDYVTLRAEVARVASAFDELREVIGSLAEDRALFPHPQLGGLSRVQWLRFAEVHQRHHHAIMEDIRRAAAAAPAEGA